MIIEMPINLKNKTKDELIILLQDSCNLIKKQQKEIAELKIDNDIMKQDLNGNIVYKDEIEEIYIQKQKIKDKIKELTDKEQHVYYSDREMCYKLNTAVCVLEELLEESEK